MKLSHATVSTILDATNLGCILDIEGLIFDEHGIRGYNDVEGVIIAAISNDYDFEFDSLGLARLQSLKHKFGLLQKLDEVDVDAVKKKNSEDVIEKLHFKCGKVDFDFRCALTKTIKDIPSKTLNKKPKFSFTITKDDVSHITQGTSSMRSANMTIQGTKDVVKFRFSCETGDTMNYRLDSDLKIHGDEDTMSLTVNIKKMLPIFRRAVQEGDFVLNILKNNIVYVSVMDFDIFVMPEV